MRIDFRRRLQVEDLNFSNVRVLAVVIGAVVFGIGYALDVLVIWRFTSAFEAILFSNLLTGLLSGVLAYQLIKRMVLRERASEAQLGTLAEMSRQLRNALLIVQHCVHEPLTREMAEREMGSVYSGMKELLSNLEPSVSSTEA
jgi:LytS/YehU family sensor histidine kinase